MAAMTEPTFLPSTNEQAKLGQKALDVLQGVGDAKEHVPTPALTLGLLGIISAVLSHYFQGPYFEVLGGKSVLPGLYLGLG